MNCWWCGDRAKSREHIFKKTDIIRANGKPPYDPAVLPLMRHGELMKFIQGPNSKHLKFRANLCHKCNTTRSSEYDKAYDVFVVGAPTQVIQIIRTNQIDLKELYGVQWEFHFSNFLKYLIKHIGCRLADADVPVPRNLVDYLDKKDDLKDVKLQVEVRLQNLAFSQFLLSHYGLKFEILNAGNILLAQSVSTNGPIGLAFFSWLTTHILSFNFIVQKDVNVKYKSRGVSNGLLQVNLTGENLPVGFANDRTLLETMMFLEEYDKEGSPEIRAAFYNRILKY